MYPPDGCPLNPDDRGLVTAIIPGQEGIYRHLRARVAQLLADSGLTTEWQVGDGREAALADHVLTHARPGDVDDALRVIDDFGRHYSYLINVGDEKGEILDHAVRRVRPRRILELGTYCGYSALRMVRVMSPNAHLYSVEFNPDNAEIARRIWIHAGINDRVTAIVGTLGDGGRTLRRLREEHGFTEGSLDFVFLDHHKDAYLPGGLFTSLI